MRRTLPSPRLALGLALVVLLTALPLAADSAVAEKALNGAQLCSTGEILAAAIPEQPSRWEYEGLVGLEAGAAMCDAASAGSHVCDFEEVLYADTAGELIEFLPEGTSAWLYRTTPAIVDGKLSPPGPGGTCLDFSYPTAHVGNGGMVNNNSGQGIVYHLDPDTTVDLKDRTGSHVSPGLPCGGVYRSILCCNRLCSAE